MRDVRSSRLRVPLGRQHPVQPSQDVSSVRVGVGPLLKRLPSQDGEAGRPSRRRLAASYTDSPFAVLDGSQDIQRDSRIVKFGIAAQSQGHQCQRLATRRVLPGDSPTEHRRTAGR